MKPQNLLLAGLAVLAFAWGGPLPAMVPASFAAHMTIHMLVVAVGMPLIAAGLAPLISHWRIFRLQVSLPIAVSILDFVVIWGWHAPALHEAARGGGWVLALEQFSFAAVALLVWLVALAAPPGDRRLAALGGAMALFFTSMHMTLLGALCGLAPRLIFDAKYVDGCWGGSPIADQQIGGVLMLAIGGAVYLLGGVTLIARVLDRRVTA